MKTRLSLAYFLFCLCAPTVAAAVTIEMVTVGNPGNAPDTRYFPTGFGSVPYKYRIGKYEITAGQYTEFLNAVAADDVNELYNDLMSHPILGSNIQRAGSSPNCTYSVALDSADRPVNWVGFWDAARFANWLHNGQPQGAQGPGTTETGAYHDVGNPALFGRNAGARFFLPTENEWYKAAYHDRTAGLAARYFDTPMGTNEWPSPGNDVTETTNPGNNANIAIFISNSEGYSTANTQTIVGEFELSASSYGTFDQGGNVAEWNETAIDDRSRGLRGGSFLQDVYFMSATTRYSPSRPAYEDWSEARHVGFRMAASIPEPASLALSIGGLLSLALKRQFQRQ